MKYIRTKSNEIIIFSDGLDHNCFADVNPKSAGFIVIENNHLMCFGENESLKLKSAAIEDTLLARKQILGIKE